MVEAFSNFLIPWDCLKENEVVPTKKAFVMQGHRKKIARPWAILVTSQCPNYLHFVSMRTWLLYGLKRKITCPVLRIARPIYMVKLFYLRRINLSHTLI